MLKTISISAILLGSASVAFAGGIDRTGQSIAVLFEQGRYAEFSFGAVSPDTSGVGTAAIGFGASGDLTPSFLQLGAAYKADINDRFSYALIYDQPFGADVDYPVTTAYFARGSKAEFESHALTGILRYKLPSNISFHGGIRVQSIEATASIPFVGNYDVKGESDVSVGYLLGVAYERPDIALRVSLTYNSEIDHDVDTIENSPLGIGNRSVTEVTTPQSLNLEFQTGIAKDTLLFGGLRWTDWSEFTIAPANYGSPLLAGGPLLSYADDVYSYTLGVGRKLNDTWSVAATVGYEKSNGGFVTNLGPTDGQKSLSLAAIYTQGNVKVTTGIRYINIGDAQTRVGAAAPAGIFEDNDAVAFGVKVGFTF